MGSQQFCLKWNNHQLNMLTVFDQLLQNEAFVDVTIACEGLSLKAHKMVLSACSPYFQNLFMDNPCKHPIVILKDIRYDEMKAIIDFMYKGEVNVSQDQLSALLKTAEALKVKGLAEVTGQGPHGQVQQGSSQSSSAASVLFETVGSRHSPPAKRKKRPPASAAVSIGSPVSPGNSNTSHSTSSHRALSPPHPVVQSAVSLAPVPSAGSVTASGMCSGDEDQSPLVGLNRSRNMEGVPGSSKDGLSNVKEEKIEIEEPPDDVEDLIMEATPEHIEIEPSTADTGFNGSTQDQSQLANIKYGNMFNPQPSTSGTSPGWPQRHEGSMLGSAPLVLVDRKNSRSRSAIWKHFGYLVDKRGMPPDKLEMVCRACFKSVRMHPGVSSNLYKHLLAKHPALYDEVRRLQGSSKTGIPSIPGIPKQ